jgi:hypothetical protein
MGRYLELLRQPTIKIEVGAHTDPNPRIDSRYQGAYPAARQSNRLTTITTETTEVEMTQTRQTPSPSGTAALAAPSASESPAPEIAWRLDAMRGQVPSSGLIPFLVARNIQHAQGTCQSCGDPIGVDQLYRCRPCVEAAILALQGWCPPDSHAGRR